MRNRFSLLCALTAVFIAGLVPGGLQAGSGPYSNGMTGAIPLVGIFLSDDDDRQFASHAVKHLFQMDTSLHACDSEAILRSGLVGMWERESP